MFNLGNPQDNDMLTSVNLDILREEMILRLDPPPPKPSEEKQETVPLTRVGQLEKNLEAQMEEEEKWQDLTTTLEKKTKQMADTVVRLDTSVKVFQHELAKRNQNVEDAQEQLGKKEQEQHLAMAKMRNDRQRELDQATKIQDRAQQVREEVSEKQERHDLLKRMLRTARSNLLPMEERVQNLQINLNGNRGMSESQVIYHSADLEVEKDQRDRVLAQIENYLKEIEILAKEIPTLKGKQGLYQDEQKRRVLKAKDLENQIKEHEELFKAKLKKFQAEVESIRQDRDAWEEKTIKLAKDLDEKRVESTKLTVKARLFNDQLKGVQDTVRRLKKTIDATLNMSVTSVGELEEDLTAEDSDAESESEPEPVKEEPYVWRAPERESSFVRRTRVQAAKSKASPPAPAPVPVIKKAAPKQVASPVVKKAVPRYVPPAVVKPAYAPSPPVVRVNHVSVKMDPVKPYEAMETPSMMASNRENGLAAQLQDVQRDLEHQKRFQKEHAIKMEQQFARLASKVEVLANSADSTAQLRANSEESQLSALKHQMQKDAMRDAQEMRQILKQLGQQCGQLSNKLEGLATSVQQRDRENARMEEKLKEKESQYFDQMECLRREMEQQLERQQQAFADKMSSAMIQMERLVTSGAAGSITKDDSMASLESLIPMEGSFRSSTEDNKPLMPVANGGYSMVTSGIKVNTPWFS